MESSELADLTVEDILGHQALIFSQMARFEVRTQQVTAAKAVFRALGEKRPLLMEAGTGTGKTFAYLVPALLYLRDNPDHRVVISSHTINLQEQIYLKDIPLLLNLMGSPVESVLLKGRSNYISRRRLRQALRMVEGSRLFSDRSHDDLRKLDSWQRNFIDGTRSDLKFIPDQDAWEQAQSDGNNCMGRSCPSFDNCFFQRSRRKGEKASLIVVNHALYAADIALRIEGAACLPDHHAVILDEGHTFEDIAGEQLGLKVSFASIRSLLSKLLRHSKIGPQGLLAKERTPELNNLHHRAYLAIEPVLSAIRIVASEKSNNFAKSRSMRIYKPLGLNLELSDILFRISTGLEEVALDKDPEDALEFTSMARRSRQLGGNLRSWIQQESAGSVYWIDPNKDRFFPGWDLHAAPIDVGKLLRENLFDRIGPVILTSATLGTGGNDPFSHARTRLGFPETPRGLEISCPSPFNYETQVDLHLHFRMPDPTANPSEFLYSATEAIKAYVNSTKGHAFILCTSKDFLEKIQSNLSLWCNTNQFPLLIQGNGEQNSMLIEKFRSTPNAVLLGLDSFWQGVDVPGDSLVNVIITKLPFSVPDRPLIEAKLESISQKGGNPFLDFQIPQAILKLRQGFGRLIRHSTDKGLVVILDPRVLTKKYGRKFLASLPVCRTWVDGRQVDPAELLGS